MSAVYTTEQIFERGGSWPGGKPILVVQANGGSVTISVRHGSGWVVSDTIAEDSVGELLVGQATIRITPDSGATFSIAG